MTFPRDPRAPAPRHVNDDCISCENAEVSQDCDASKRPCGHHCNHSWTHDSCCHCGEVFGEAGDA